MSNDAAPPAPYGTHRPTGALAVWIWLTRNTWAGRGRLRRPLRNLLTRRPRPLDLDTWGLPMRLHAGATSCETKVALAPRHYERAELDFLRGALARPGAVFLDVGANVGLYSFNLIGTLPHALMIHAFEPQPEMLARLHVSLALAADRMAATGTSVRVHPYGLGPQAATMEMVRPGGDYGSASVFEAFSGEEGDRIAIEVRDVLAVFDELGLAGADAMKIDIEGFEAQVLGPLIDHRPDALPRAICIEHLAEKLWGRDLVGELVALGYRKVGRERANTLLKRD